MTSQLAKRILFSSIFLLAPWSTGWAQVAAPVPSAGSTASAIAPDATKESFDRAINDPGNWYFSWGFSRQQYAPSDIHISQPGLGSDFTVHQVAATDSPASVWNTITSSLQLEFTNPQQNVRIGKFLNPEKTFAVEFSIDHSKYNVDHDQSAPFTGTINNQPHNGKLNLNPLSFNYALHNGLNHLMLNAVWLHHLTGPSQQAGHLQSISRVGAGMLLPHADTTIFGNENQLGPKGERICCLGRDDWWQINGWTAGVEVGLRYAVNRFTYLELTQKFAYGALSRVPVYQGSADQTIWMSEQVMSMGFRF